MRCNRSQTPYRSISLLTGAHGDRSANRDGSGPILVLKHRTGSP
ncbi:hypothetical protein I545_2922 [Mycobacterium kansasii 662]|uniref:Uncharacterized protein n=2 Tax=Mycobacterium kansasii TaxID=1768 RepID=A0A1V3WZ13_MYCKA|nr:hypothetical protein I547_4893 [Mycobacterium kansasii 824]EUA18539.1 hypothetical protein I545_2922 [Mycobacterium kansasii 662]KEP41156.1 hypothetical protein MKSMC1_35770 [Mycobacterium kansasii]OOK67955.1 hypothetical protein BZL29_6627 [Mycobacterium kansasii]OOK72072.1 hypothetical protein BZL30_5881 [Mycobacterium kansasii]